MDRSLAKPLACVLAIAGSTFGLVLASESNPTTADGRSSSSAPAATHPSSQAASRQLLYDQLVEKVDALLAGRWEEEGVVPASPCDDGTFIRRVSLDLTGVVPRVAEVRQFLKDPAADKRDRLVDRLLQSPRYATHLATTWRNRMIPPEAADRQPEQVLGVQNWLRNHFANNTRFDNVVADLFVATDGNEIGPALYYLAHDLAPDKLATSTAELFLGMRLNCAQCHDHPFDRWTQHDFWGYAAFFARVRSDGDAGQRTVYRLTDATSGEVMLPDTDEVVPPIYLGGRAAGEARRGTRRMQLAIWTASRDNPYLARATVNWAWSHLFGRGIVEPLGDAGTHNPPSHPELLDLLADVFYKTDFDVRGLLEALTRTRAYQLSSRHDSPSPPELFNCMQVKPLTGEQLYDSVRRIAPAAIANLPGGMQSGGGVLDPRRVEFVRRMRTPSTGSAEYSAGLLQSLLFMNGPLMATATSADDSGILGALDAPFLSERDCIDAIFLATLARFPTPHERASCEAATVDLPPLQRRERLGDVLWALLNTTEFAFNN